MYALVDCNSFFCAVERAFTPGIHDKPVVVAGSNDGIIVALTPEAKALGLKRGDAVFKVRDIVNANNVRVFSGNMMLYAAMSRRIVSILRQSIAHVENYSIDESFCDLRGYENFDIAELMRGVGERIRLYTDIPVSIGVAPTKTLAKMGSKFAKQFKGYRGVCVIDTDEKRRKALELFDLSNVWGIGRQTLDKLRRLGISTPIEFAEKSESWVRCNFNKPGLMTWLELNGIPCVDTSETIRNKSVCTSRSFGQMVGDLPSLKAAVAGHASSCANKLRGQTSVARMVTVFVCSNRFREDLVQYWNKASITLFTPTADTLEITSAAFKALDNIYRPDIMYKKCGVILSEITKSSAVQMDLFDPVRNRLQRAELMNVIDGINHRYGVKTIRLGVEGYDSQPWHVKCEYRTPNYLTDINEIMVVK